MGLKEILEPIAEKLQSGTNVRAVYGDPVEAHGKTIIPVAKVAYGFGGGFSGKKDAGNGKPGKDEGGAGGGAAAKPMGVIEVSEEGTRYIPIHSGKKLAGILALGFIAGYLVGRR
ncbi:MAG: sporulation protein YtfJ [Candidatus Dadabacteria bacterium]|nr:sporulation protein YtfJ [Candidatus Dadabacteria bacterium]